MGQVWTFLPLSLAGGTTTPAKDWSRGGSRSKTKSLKIQNMAQSITVCCSSQTDPGIVAGLNGSVIIVLLASATTQSGQFCTSEVSVPALTFQGQAFEKPSRLSSCTQM